MQTQYFVKLRFCGFWVEFRRGIGMEWNYLGKDKDRDRDRVGTQYQTNRDA